MGTKVDLRDFEGRSRWYFHPQPSPGSLVSLQPAKNWKVHLWDMEEVEILIINEQLTDMQQLRDVIMSIWPKTWRIEAALKTNGAPTFHCPAVPDKVADERILWDQFKPTTFVSRGSHLNVWLLFCSNSTLWKRKSVSMIRCIHLFPSRLHQSSSLIK